MKADRIADIGIDDAGSLWVKPATIHFPYFYREAMEVGWDVDRELLFSPKPRQRILGEPTRAQWFQPITDAAREQGTALPIDADTRSSGIDASLKAEIEASIVA